LINIKELTKNTLFQLKDENISTTPEHYFVEFKKQAEKANIELDEFKEFNRIKNSLTQEEKNSLKIESFNELANILSQRITTDELKNLVATLSDILTPSIDYSFIEDIEEFILKNIKNPKTIISNDSLEKLKELSKKRVDADRKVLKDKTDDVVKLTSLMSRYFDKTLNDGKNSTEEIIKIKDELLSLNISSSSFRELKIVEKKLIDTIYNIEHSMKENHKMIEDNKEKFQQLNRQIEELQKELVLVKEEYQVDYLTNILNRRAYHKEVEKMEKKFSIFNANYAIVFYDIDHFKEINDQFGHSCGDSVLKNFAAILKDLTRKEDIIARYGGEEFVALVNYQEEIEVQRYIKRVKKTLENANFLYKDSQIKIKFSAGITYRNKYETFTDAKKRADELLYEAKHKGRNKIIIDDGIEL
jgi:diguanylate cyclase (GGDEF)-like protein